MKKEEKQLMIDELSRSLDENNVIYITDISVSMHLQLVL